LSNSVKYSEAKNLRIILNYQSDKIEITATDDGKGFEVNDIEKGAGLINMKSRASLIKADLKLTSKLSKGVKMVINYRLN